MTLDVPPELATTLRRLDRSWPVSDEQTLNEIAAAFLRIRPTIQSATATMEQALVRVEATNDPRLTGSINHFLSTAGSLSSLKDFDGAAASIAHGFHSVAGTVVALKAVILGHLVLLATVQQVARYDGAAGAATLTIALEETRRLVDEAVALAVQAVQGGEDADDGSDPADVARPQELERLAAWADERQDSQDYEAAVEIWHDLLAQLPEPTTEHPLAMWALAPLGDALFELGRFEEANEALAGALLAGGTGEAFVWLRKGQALVEVGDEEAGVEALTSALMLMGDEILDDEDPKYRQLLVDRGIIKD